MLRNAIHEVLTIAGQEVSDNYFYSDQWIQFFQQYTRLKRILDEKTMSKLVPLSIQGNIPLPTQDQIYEALAPKGYAKMPDPENNSSLYRFSLRIYPRSLKLFDGSSDMKLSVSLERVSDQGVLQVLTTREFWYNTSQATSELPPSVLADLLTWIVRGGVPIGSF